MRWVVTLLVMGGAAAVMTLGGWLLVIGPALEAGTMSSAYRASCFAGPDPLWVGVGALFLALILVLTLVAIRAGEVEILEREGVKE